MVSGRLGYMVWLNRHLLLEYFGEARDHYSGASNTVDANEPGGLFGNILLRSSI